MFKFNWLIILALLKEGIFLSVIMRVFVKISTVLLKRDP